MFLFFTSQSTYFYHARSTQSSRTMEAPRPRPTLAHPSCPRACLSHHGAHRRIYRSILPTCKRNGYIVRSNSSSFLLLRRRLQANASHSTWFIVAFSILNLLILALEVILFVKHKLPTRIYLISQWAKATLAGIVWVTIEFLTYTHWQWKYVAGFATSNFVFQQ